MNDDILHCIIGDLVKIKDSDLYGLIVATTISYANHLPKSFYCVSFFSEDEQEQRWLDSADFSVMTAVGA